MHGHLGVQLVPRPSHTLKGYAPAPHNLAAQGIGYGPPRPPRSAPGAGVILRPSIAGTRPKGCPPTAPPFGLPRLDQGVFEEVDDAFDAALENLHGGGAGRGHRRVIRYEDEYNAQDGAWDGGSEDEAEAISAGRWRNRGGRGGRQGGRGGKAKGSGKDSKGRGRGRGIGSEVLEDPWAELVAADPAARHLRAHLDGLVDDLESEEEIDEAKAKKDAQDAERRKLTEDVKKFKAAVEEEDADEEMEDAAGSEDAAAGAEKVAEAVPETGPPDTNDAAGDDTGAAGGGTSIYDFFHDDDDAMI